MLVADEQQPISMAKTALRCHAPPGLFCFPLVAKGRTALRIMFEMKLNPALVEADCDFTVNESAVNPAAQAPVGSASIYADQRLAQEASRALREAGFPALRDLEIEVTRGVVILWGKVPTYHQKQLAQATVQKLDGIRGIANGIDVICAPSRRAGR